MKKFFTPLFVLLLSLVGATTVSAQDEVKELTADMFYSWDGYGADATSLSKANVDFNVGNDVQIAEGGMVCGTSTVDYLIYANLTGSSKLIINGTPGLRLRVLMNRQESNNGPLVEKNPTIGDDGTVELDLTTMEYVHINSIKLGWGSPAGLINSIQYVVPADPLEVPKETLKNVISTAKLYNSVAMTPESYAALQSAIAGASAALTAADATAESLAAATSKVNEAVKGLTLAEGYSDLTKEMFKEYASIDNPGDGTSAGCAYDLFTSTGLAYGDGNVNWLYWADLTNTIS